MAMQFNPYQNQGGFAGMFNVESRGLTQGDAQDDPAIRLQLCSGMYDKTAMNTIWGGVGVVETLTPANMNVVGSTIKPATAVVNAFTVFNQAFHGITMAGSPVPQFLPGGSVHYFRLGSSARIPLPISADVAAMAEDGAAVTGDGFVWDTEQNLVDVLSSGSSAFPQIAIKLLMVSPDGNLTVKKQSNGNLVWADMPCGLFMI
jgi:hypothetical protein